MSTSFSSEQLERFRREAKKLSRELSFAHSEALDRIAARHGFRNWSLLVKHSAASSTAIAEKGSVSAPLNARHRYYLHGDLVEGVSGKCYCARCDLLCDLSHFQPISWHQDGEDGERFLSSLARWNKLKPSEKGNRYRPIDAPNVLQQGAEAARAAREASRSPFHKWLEGQRHRNDPVGDLAGDVLRDKHFPLGTSTLREMEDYLSRYGDHAIRAAQNAWREFEASPDRALAQALADELDISVAEAEELVDAEPQKLTGHSDEMTYGYLFDFTDYASPRLRAKLLKTRGSLQLEVGPWFFETVHSQAV